MRISLVSDLHLDKLDDEAAELVVHGLAPWAEQDALVVAGDLAEREELEKYLSLICRQAVPTPVLYVLGNHEAYDIGVERAELIVRGVAEKYENLHFLNRSATTIAGQRFIGCTLWYPMPLSQRWADFRAIPDHALKLHELSARDRFFLDENLRSDDIVITHMLPSWNCVAEKWKESHTNQFFVHDLSYLIADRQPKAWLFGHTHERLTLELGSTKAFCRPRGYGWEDASDVFDPSEIIEL